MRGAMIKEAFKKLCQDLSELHLNCLKKCGNIEPPGDLFLQYYYDYEYDLVPLSTKNVAKSYQP